METSFTVVASDRALWGAKRFLRLVFSEMRPHRFHANGETVSIAKPRKHKEDSGN